MTTSRSLLFPLDAVRVDPADAPVLDARATAEATSAAPAPAGETRPYLRFGLGRHPAAMLLGGVERVLTQMGRSTRLPGAHGALRVCFVDGRATPVCDGFAVTGQSPRDVAALEKAPALVLAGPDGHLLAFAVSEPVELLDEVAMAADGGVTMGSLPIAGHLRDGTLVIDAAQLVRAMMPSTRGA